MGYPAKGYRRGANRHSGGFQGVNASPWRPTQAPANDNGNRYGTGRPANDNAPARASSSKRTPRIPRSLKGAGLAAIGVAAWELWKWWLPENAPVSTYQKLPAPGGYIRYRANCVTGIGPPNVNRWGWKNGLNTNDPKCDKAVFGFGLNAGETAAQSFANGRFYVGFQTHGSINAMWIPDAWIKVGTPAPPYDPVGEVGDWHFPTTPTPTMPTPEIPPAPSIWPEINPLEVPYGVPLPTPRPLPVRFPRRPEQDPHNPYSPRREQPNNRPGVRPRPGQRPSSRPVTRPVQRPAIQIAATPAGVTSGGGRHTDRPRRNERKAIAQPHNANLFMGIAASITEFGDFVGAFHDALPRDCQVSGGAIQQFHAVLNCLDRLDLHAALHNLIANEINDRIYGAVGQAQAGVNRRLDRPRNKEPFRQLDGEVPDIGEAVADFILGPQ